MIPGPVLGPHHDLCSLHIFPVPGLQACPGFCQPSFAPGGEPILTSSTCLLTFFKVMVFMGNCWKSHFVKYLFAHLSSSTGYKALWFFVSMSISFSGLSYLSAVTGPFLHPSSPMPIHPFIHLSSPFIYLLSTCHVRGIVFDARNWVRSKRVFSSPFCRLSI